MYVPQCFPSKMSTGTYIYVPYVCMYVCRFLLAKNFHEFHNFLCTIYVCMHVQYGDLTHHAKHY